MIKIPIKIIYIIVPILFLIIFSIDLFSFYSGLTFTTLINLKEILVIFLTLSWVLIHKKFAKLQSFSLKQKLGYPAIFLSINYVVFFILNLFINPEYTNEFPHQYQSLTAIFDAQTEGILAYTTLIPTLMILRDLIFSTQKRKPRL